MKTFQGKKHIYPASNSVYGSYIVRDISILGKVTAFSESCNSMLKSLACCPLLLFPLSLKIKFQFQGLMVEIAVVHQLLSPVGIKYYLKLSKPYMPFS